MRDLLRTAPRPTPPDPGPLLERAFEHRSRARARDRDNASVAWAAVLAVLVLVTLRFAPNDASRRAAVGLASEGVEVANSVYRRFAPAER